MKYLMLILSLLLLVAPRLDAQGICDSTISIAPIQPICQGTGEVHLEVSHPGGVFSGPGLIYGTSYLTTEFLSAGFKTATYTITGPGGCTVKATQQFEVRNAQQVFATVSGKIDCSNPNSKVQVSSSLMGNYFGANWSGPLGSGIQVYNNSFMTGYAGLYRFKAYPANFNECPAFGSADVKFENNLIPIKIEDCTNCDDWPQKIRIAMVPPNWVTTVKSPNGNYYSPADSTGCFAAILATGLWKVEALNPDNGCKSTASQFLDTQNARPSVSAGSNISIWCNGAGSFLSALSPASGSLFNYFWTTPNGSTVPASHAGLLQATDPGTYVLHGVNTFTGCEDTDTAFAIISPTPVSTQIAVICDGENLFGYTQAGSYTDTILQANGCPKIRILKITALAPLVGAAVVIADNGQMTGSIEYSVSQGWPPFVFNWSNGENTASIFNLSAGTYTVTVTDANDCQHIREVEIPLNRPVRHAAGYRTTPVFIKARIFPNPVLAGTVAYTLEVNSSEVNEATLSINDLLGRNILTHEVQIQEGENVFSLSENLLEGLYSVFLTGSFGKQEISKLVVLGR